MKHFKQVLHVVGRYIKFNSVINPISPRLSRGMSQVCGLAAQVGPSILKWLLSPISTKLVQSLDLVTGRGPWICSLHTQRSSSINWVRTGHHHQILSIPAHNAGASHLTISPWWHSLCWSAQLSVCMLPSTVWHRHCTTCWDAVQLPVSERLTPKSIPGRWCFYLFYR